MKDRRSHIRWDIPLVVHYSVEGCEGETVSSARDISNSGICLCSPEKLPVNAPVKLAISVADEKGSISARGTIIWQTDGVKSEDRHFLCGVKFSSLADTDKDRLFQCIYHHRREELTKRWWAPIQN